MVSRRDFIKKGSLLAGSFVAGSNLSNGNNTDAKTNVDQAAGIQPIRVSGRVVNGGRGVSRVQITDGVTVTATGTDGRFDFMSTNQQQFVYMSVPTGYKIPKSSTGTAAFYHPLRPNNDNRMSVDFQLEKADTDHTKHSFLVLADPQMLDQEDMDLFHQQTVPDVIQTVDELALKDPFGITCGDILFDDLSLFPQYEKGVSKTGIPFYQALGNHDVEVDTLTDEDSDDTYIDYFGPPYYSFDRGEIHYIVLDDVFWFGQYIGYVTEKQLNWLKQDLSYVEEGKTVVTFLHIPAYTNQHKRNGQDNPSNSVVVTNRQLLYDILAPYNSYLISGHTHESEFLTNGGCEHHVAGAVCGAWWTGPVCADGTPRGYAIYDVDGGDLRWRYKSTGKPIDHQIRIYKPGQDGNDTDQLVANIWGADESWTVKWVEDGEPRGAMKQKTGKDPLAQKLYDGENKPEKHTWVSAWNTSHLYHAKPSSNASTVAVEATDRWGNSYRQTVAL